MLAAHPTVSVPHLGQVVGIKSSAETESFLGIPYGHLTGRWTRPTKLLSFANGRHDGTVYGPTCPQLPNHEKIYQLAVPELVKDPEVALDEFACLNLNIVRPATSSKNAKLPVMVWFHGGALAIGRNSETLYNGIEFVKRSIEIQKPVIHISIGYRLGFFGFLASSQLLEESGGKSAGNYGLWDQKTALDFIYEGIEYFDGDKNQVTLFGESAGATSIHAHLLAEKATFQQAICQSGTLNTAGPFEMSSRQHQGIYDKLVTALKVSSLAELRRVPSDKLVAAMPQVWPGLPMGFITDDRDLVDGYFPRGTKFDGVSLSKRLIIGYSEQEAFLFAMNLLQIPAEVVQASIAKSGLGMSILESYGPKNPLSPTEALAPALATLVTDLAWRTPVHSVLKSAAEAGKSDQTFVYEFCRPNSWPGSAFSGFAHHLLILFYIANIPASIPTLAPEVDQKVALNVIDRWIAFANKEDPWPACGQEQNRFVFAADGSSKVVSQSSEQHVASTRDAKVLDAMRSSRQKIVDFTITMLSGGI